MTTAVDVRTRLRPAWALVPAVAFPILFLHLRYQPEVQFGLGSTTVGVELSDLAVLVVAAAAVAAGVRLGWRPLRAGRTVWLLAGLFLADVVAATFYPLLWEHHYHELEHLVTAAKLCEYAALAPALPLLLRRRADLLPLLWTAAVWSALASGWGLLQFAGLVNEFAGKRPLQREPSFLGIHDFAALSGAAFSLGLVLALRGVPAARERALATVALVAGALGLVLCAAFTGVAGVTLALVATLVVLRARRGASLRSAAAAGLILLAATVGAALMRGGELVRTIRSAGIGSPAKSEAGAESYGQRRLAGYIGLRIFGDHPLVGVGWQGSVEEENYAPYLADAHRRYPEAPDIAFPSPAHPWGTQNAYIQVLADLGLVGAGALLAFLAGGAALGVRAALRAPPDGLVSSLVGVVWLLVAVGVWNGLDLVAGNPLEALTWIAVGLIAASAAWQG